MIKLLEGMETQGEGNISWFPNREETLKQFLMAYPPKVIVEIGFCMGHSMKLIIDTLTEKNNCLGCDYSGIEKIYVFDICEGTNNGIGGNHNYVKPNFEIMKKHYKDIDMILIEGDSLETVKPFMDSLEGGVDFIEIDGFHEGINPAKDIENTIDKLNIGGYIYVDDYNNQYTAIKNAVDNRNWSDFDTFYYQDVFIARKIR